MEFPRCWNGKPFDQANPFAHMAYPKPDPVNGYCQAPHTTSLPFISIENDYGNLTDIADLVEPDSFVLAQGDPSGCGLHMDFYGGWKSGTLANFLTNCPFSVGGFDIGNCPDFKPGDYSGCTMPTPTYPEELDNPKPYLPGCKSCIFSGSYHSLPLCVTCS